MNGNAILDSGSTQTLPAPAAEITSRRQYNKPRAPKKPRPSRRKVIIPQQFETIAGPPNAEQVKVALGEPPAPIALTHGHCKLSAELLIIIEDAISAGMSIAGACELAGIDDETYQFWREGNPQIAKRFKLVERRSELTFIRLLKETVDAGNRCWTGYAWFLERRYGWINRSESSSTSTNTNVNLTLAKEVYSKMGAAGDVHVKERSKEIDITP